MTLAFSEEIKTEQLERETNYFQIDFLKAVMIFLVIYDHIVDWSVKSQIGVAFWERISIPVFLFIMGFNWGNSFKRHEDSSLKELYSWKYFSKKISRFVLPFLMLYLVSMVIGWMIYDFDFMAMYNTQYFPHWGSPVNLFTGIMVFWGPGNWFIPVIFQAIIILPLVYYGFTKKPVLTLILCFVSEIIMQASMYFLIGGEITTWEEYSLLMIFMTSVFTYLPGIGLGFWFSKNHNLKSRRNWFIWILFVVSVIYLYFHQFENFRFRDEFEVPLLRGDYHLFIIPYSAVLVLLALRYIPMNPKGKFAQKISTIGKSTYHILLIQIFGLGLMLPYWGTHYAIYTGFTPDEVLDLLIPWLIFIPVGIKWYHIDQNKSIGKRVLYGMILLTIFGILVNALYYAASTLSMWF